MLDLTFPSKAVQQFDCAAFEFTHALRDNPLLDLAKLSQVIADKTHRPLISYHSSKASYDGGWESLYSAPKKSSSVSEAMSQMRESSAWIKVRLNEHPDYSSLTHGLITELSDALKFPLERDSSRINITVFISSPGAVTPYHFDHETNFLFQIKGSKKLTVFDPAKVLSHEELEAFYSIGGFSYRPEVDKYAEHHTLTPGCGIHNPSLWPHAAKTLDDVSVTLSINISLNSRDIEARVFQCNYYLRRLGLKPKPIGISRLSDGLKKLFLATPFQRSLPLDQDPFRTGVRRIQYPIEVFRKLGSVSRQ